ncbi:helix-turn-helix transcriptional regulator [Nitrosospira lacus]|uniref:Helix-turn-helix transcriptional regulator n=1 Tax=Nitrosospira lacus TaxID=1288494 RepID=A0A1W6SM26_9PROT|nr:XrtB/PEP-CTERM-associated transcriptional regulator EpsA [Nitrosospira lacus]ARO86856.1 helix-turn-helix transcriptional regulator [Nitrosospira lacus]
MTYKMDQLSTLSAEHLDRYHRIITEAIGVSRHKELLAWLQGELQHYLPHEILISAWGDFTSKLICYDIVSALPGIRTEYSNPQTLSPLLQGLFNRWVELGKLPYTLGVGDSGFLLEEGGLSCPLGKALQGMRTLLVHGLIDERSDQDCLYIIFSSERKLHDSLGAMQILLPYLDTALSQVTPLAHPEFNAPVLADQPQAGEYWGLSKREIEIMNWVRIGKTNLEIASILGISVFTVKNHLQHVFKALDVATRMQAVIKIAQIRKRGS